MLTEQFTCDEPSTGVPPLMARTARRPAEQPRGRRRVQPAEHAPAGVWFPTSTEPGYMSSFVFSAAVDGDVQGGVPTS